jgi:hypothetical protein
MFKKKQSTKAIMSALLESNIDSLNLSKNLASDHILAKQEFEDMIKEKVIKKALEDNKGLILDLGAFEHYTPYKDYLIDYKPVSNKWVIIANGVRLPVLGIGHIPVFINQDTFLIKNVNYIPNIKSTLISSKELTNKGWEILFKKDLAILSYNQKVITNAKWHFNAYFLDKVFINHKALEPVVYNITSYNKSPMLNSAESELNSNINSKNAINNLLDLYHQRLLHINKDYIIRSAEHSTGLTMPNPELNLYNCDSCYYAKFKEIISRKPNNPVNILEFIDCNILGPFKIKGIKGENYIFSITCRASKYIWLYAIKHKSDVYDIIINYYNMILT